MWFLLNPLIQADSRFLLSSPSYSNFKRSKILSILKWAYSTLLHLKWSPSKQIMPSISVLWGSSLLITALSAWMWLKQKWIRSYWYSLEQLIIHILKMLSVKWCILKWSFDRLTHFRVVYTIARSKWDKPRSSRLTQVKSFKSIWRQARSWTKNMFTFKITLSLLRAQKS